LIVPASERQKGQQMEKGIRTLKTRKDPKGNYQYVRLVFGPHYFVELHGDENGKVTFILGATHHGFRADASEVNGELEQLINEIRETHPDKSVD
jgi:hypothetical protein